MSYMLRPQSCRFMLYEPFTKLIGDQLKDVAFNPLNGVQLQFQCCNDECNKTVIVEVDARGNLSKVEMTDPDKNSTDMVFDFSRDIFLHYDDPPRELIAGHPLFHMLQKTTAAHYQAGYYLVTSTAL